MNCRILISRQVKEFAKAKIDSAKTVVKDTLNAIKKQLGNAAKEELSKKLFGAKDTTTVTDNASTLKNPAPKTKESVKGVFKNLLKKKAKDTTRKE